MFILSIGSAVEEALRMFMLSLCELIYKLIIFGFNVFEKIGNANILSAASVESLFNKVSLILGLFMIFRLSFSFIQYMVNPDTMTDKKNGIGNIIKKVIIVIVLLGSVNSLFNMAYKVQSLINEDQIIPRIILGNNDNYSSAESGGIVAQSLFYTFFRINPQVDDPSVYMDYVIENDIRNGDFDTIKAYINEREKIKYDNEEKEEFVYQFDGSGLGCLFIGCVAVYLILVFTIQVGVRLFQLAYLQIIAPIPIMMYITPKGDEKLKKWGSQCLITFLDFFLRTAIIYFSIYLINILVDDLKNANESMSGLWQTGGGFSTTVANAYILGILIIAILIFAKKVPKLIKEIFPSVGGAGAFDYGLNLKKTVNDTLAPALFGAGVGAVGGLASNTIHGFINTRKDFKEKGAAAGFKSLGKSALSMVGGFAGGAAAGLKTKDITKTGNAVKVANANREKRELMAKAGYHWYDVAPKLEDKVLSFAGETSGAEAKMKTAQFRQEALQQTKALKWQGFAERNPGADLGLLRSIQEFEEKGKKVYRGIDMTGTERTFTKSSNGDFVDSRSGIVLTGAEADIVNESMALDKQIKDQGKIIKGLQKADEQSKK